MTSGFLSAKGGKYYAVMNWYGPDGRQHFAWLSLGLETYHNERRAEQLLEEVKNAFDPKRLGRTNAALSALGLKPITGRRAKAIEGTAAPEEGHSEEGMTPLMNFGDAVEWWVEEIRPSVALSTYSGYREQAHQSVAPWFRKRGITLGALGPGDIQAFYREKGASVSANTIKHFHAIIKETLDFAYRRDLIPENPIWKVTLPKAEPFIGSFYNLDELRALFLAARGTKLEFAVLMASHYGLRREEIVGLKWDAIDFQMKCLTVRHTVTEYVVDGKPTLIARDAAKTSRSVRTLPLFPDVEDFLLKMKLEQEKWAAFYGRDYDHSRDAYVYRNEDGSLVRPNYISRYFPKLIKRNGLKKIRFHDLRHTCATLLRNEGVPMEDIQKWMGHSEISTTERIYAHFDERGNLQTSDRMADALGVRKVGSSGKGGAGDDGPEM
jgi:integrase